MPDFNYDNFDIVADIADRAERIGFQPAIDDRMHFMMDIMAADGVNGNAELRLDRLLHQFDDANFGHDISGIYRHLNRETGELEGCFLPRCAA